MTDLSKTIEPKSDQLNADDLIAGPRTITITGVRGIDGSPQPIAISFEGDHGKPYLPCKSMRRMLVAAWGSDGSKYLCRSLTLYCDQNVKFGGISVGGIRISHMSNISKRLTVALTVTRAKRSPFTVEPLTAPVSASPDSAPIAAQIDSEQDQTAVAIAKAEDAASGGTEAFSQWWNSDVGKSCRTSVKAAPGSMDKIKKICADADVVEADDDAVQF